MKKPKISVIVPVYNAEKCISKCIESVLIQSMMDWELILVDDGSIDLSKIICEKYARQDARIRVISKINGGVSSARNTGLNQAQGEYILFVDADDQIKPMALSQLYDVAIEKESDLVFGGYEIVGSDALLNDIETLEKLSHEETIITQEKLISLFLTAANTEHLMGYVWRILFRHDLLVDNNIRFVEGIKMSEDFWMIMETIMIAKSFAVLPQKLYVYQVNASSVTSKYISTLSEDMYKVNDWIRNTILPVYPSMEMGYLSCVANTYINCVQNICREGSPYNKGQRVKAIKNIKTEGGYKEALKKIWRNKKLFYKKGWIAVLMFRWNLEVVYMTLYSAKQLRKR